MMGSKPLGFIVAATIVFLPASYPAKADPVSRIAAKAQGPATDVSAQERRERRRAPIRIEVRPLRGPVYRECVPVFEERLIPQWGGRVLYASQRCWWTRG
jgi:hypothetical protein